MSGLIVFFHEQLVAKITKWHHAAILTSVMFYVKRRMIYSGRRKEGRILLLTLMPFEQRFCYMYITTRLCVALG